MMAGIKGFNAIATGRVQGVGYRYFAQRTAARFGLSGFARNLPDGTVEIAAEGPEQALLDFIEELKKGPGFSRIENVHVTWVDAARGF